MTPSRDDSNHVDYVDSTELSFSESHCKDVEILHEQSLIISKEEANDMHGY